MAKTTASTHNLSNRGVIGGNRRVVVTREPSPLAFQAMVGDVMITWHCTMKISSRPSSHSRAGQDLWPETLRSTIYIVLRRCSILCLSICPIQSLSFLALRLPSSVVCHRPSPSFPGHAVHHMCHAVILSYPGVVPSSPPNSLLLLPSVVVVPCLHIQCLLLPFL